MPSPSRRARYGLSFVRLNAANGTAVGMIKVALPPKAGWLAEKGAVSIGLSFLGPMLGARARLTASAHARCMPQRRTVRRSMVRNTRPSTARPIRMTVISPAKT